MAGRTREGDPVIRQRVVRALTGSVGGKSARTVVNQIARDDPSKRKAAKSEVRSLINSGEVVIGPDLRLVVPTK